MTKQVLIAGGGIGGLAAAVAASHAGWQARLFEQAAQFAEVGAGIQLGPNATRLLHHWGLDGPLAAVASFPRQLVVRNALDGATLARKPLGADIAARYGAPYATLHRADLHALLLQAVRGVGTQLHRARHIATVAQDPVMVRLRDDDGVEVEGDALVGADGLWSAVREQVWADGAPHPTGHLAYRTLIQQARLPASWRSQDVAVWLGPRLHVVAYPVRGGEWMNVVVIVEGKAAGDARDWDHAARARDLQAAMGRIWPPLQDLVHAVSDWRLWVLHERAPVAGPHAMARGRVALLGDAAHPMRPYLAQGAGMAIEDAFELGRVLAMEGGAIDVPTVLSRYALNRWERNARVQRRSQRNGRIFHAQGPVQWGRDLSLRLLGGKLLDVPWLYRGGA